MKIDTARQEDHQIKLTVEVEAPVLDGAKRRAARKIAQQVKIPGFRPGKAPYNVVLRQVGEGAVLEDALDILLDDIYPQIIAEADIDPYGPGSLENIVSMEPPIFEFMVPLAPEVKLGDYRAIRLPFEPKEVADEDIEEVLSNLREQHAIIEPVERSVEAGDLVYILLSGEQVQPDENETAAFVEERKLPIVVENESTDPEDEYPFPGFSQMLIGLSVGEEKTINHTYPSDSEYEDLQGVEIAFKVKIEEVKARTLPTLDDEFAKSVGDYESLADLHTKVAESIAEHLEAEQNAQYESEIVDEIVEDAEIKFPPQMLDHEIEHALQDLTIKLSSQGLDMDTYLKSRETDMDALRAELQPSAQERIQRSLALTEVGRQEKISIPPGELETLAKGRIEELGSILPEEQVSKLLSGDGLQNLMNNILVEEMTTRTLKRLRSIAKGEFVETEDEPQEETDAAEAAQFESTTEESVEA